jgi:hypothetical protein
MWSMLAPATQAYENISREDVEGGLRSGDFMLFRGAHSLAVVCPYGGALRVGLAGGDLEELLEVEQDICSYAIENGFSSVEIIGRPGWERVLDGYERTAVLMRKELRHGLPATSI